MESILGIIGGMCGITGFVFAIIVTIRQAKVEKMYAQKHAEKKGRHAQELEMYAQEMTRTERLRFLTDRIFDPYIPKEFKQPFYEEYISMKGNGTAVRFWQLEGERDKKAQQPA
jgi:hypothetical protein